MRSPFDPRARKVAGGLLAALGLAAATGAVLSASSGHRRPPSPSGMVFRIEEREVANPMDRFEVVKGHWGGPGIALRSRWDWRGPPRISIWSYPGGRKLLELDLAANEPLALVDSLDVVGDLDGDGWDELRVQSLPTLASSSAYREWSRCWDHGWSPRVRAVVQQAPERSSADSVCIEPIFDFDADGVADLLENQADGCVRVLSGITRVSMFEDCDPIEYESSERGIELGDVEGDGYAEIALLHPRMDRSRYDFELWDRLLPTRSWITIVSGSRIGR